MARQGYVASGYQAFFTWLTWPPGKVLYRPTYRATMNYLQEQRVFLQIISWNTPD